MTGEKASINHRIDKSLLYLELLPVLAFTTYFDINQMHPVRQISAAVVNVSGRQRMLSQQTALLSLQLVHSQSKAEREQLRSSLLGAIELMEKSHKGLLDGDASINLPGQPSDIVKAMYFEPPLNLDQQVRQYIAEARCLIQTKEAELTLDNPHLRYILKAASTDLLAALDAVVSQYQKESNAEQLALDIKQAELYEQTFIAAAQAQAQANQLTKALHDLQQTQAQLIQSEKISGLGHLVAGVAHEINNPVNFIYGNLNYARGYVQDLLNLLHLYQKHYPNPYAEIQGLIESIDLDFLVEDLPAVLSSMTMGAERICQIVLNLRNFSRLEEAQMKPMNIHEGLESTLLLLKHRLKGKTGHSSIHIVKEYGDLPPVECYAGQLNQVFMNILSNAIDALDELNGDRLLAQQDEVQADGSTQINWQPATPSIWIRTEVSRLNTVAIRIADNGSGISEEAKARLFEPFFTTKPTGKGTGLGLSISYQIIVEKHNGSLRCESELGKGTEFCIEIPIWQNNAPSYSASRLGTGTNCSPRKSVK